MESLFEAALAHLTFKSIIYSWSALMWSKWHSTAECRSQNLVALITGRGWVQNKILLALGISSTSLDSSPLVIVRAVGVNRHLKPNIYTVPRTNLFDFQPKPPRGIRSSYKIAEEFVDDLMKSVKVERLLRGARYQHARQRLLSKDFKSISDCNNMARRRRARQ
jgi:hypothetical protein